MDFFPLWNSLRIAFFASIIIFFVGIFLAYFIRKCPKIIKGILDIFLMLPLVLPPTIVGYILLQIFGTSQPIGSFLANIGIRFVMDWKGGIIASTVVAFPLMYRSARASFEAFDENLAYAGKTLGLSNHYIFWRIRIPACKNGIIAGIVLAFARALGEYGATNMLAGYIIGHTNTVSTTIPQIWQTEPMTAVVWTLINMGIAAVVLIAVNMLESKKGATK